MAPLDRPSESRSGAWKLDSGGSWPYGHIVDVTFGFALSRLFHGDLLTPGSRGHQGRAMGRIENPTVLDVGAGVGVYGAFFAGCLPEDRVGWTGIDGTEGVDDLSSKGPLPQPVKQVNLCSEGSYAMDHGVHDWSMSLEVGEHIPQSCLLTFLRTLDRSNRRGIVLSWGHLGQSGIGHISPRTGTDVASMMRFLGYWEDHNASAMLTAAAATPWFSVNPRVYRRRRPSSLEGLRWVPGDTVKRDREYYSRRALAKFSKCQPRFHKAECEKQNANVSTYCTCFRTQLDNCTATRDPW